MDRRQFRTKEELLSRARAAIGIPMREIDRTGRLETGKGALGTVIEESWFGYPPNNTAGPDFPEVGVELKVIPYIKNGKGIRAKERLVCNLIDYMGEYKNRFQTSDFWSKCQNLLIMTYRYQKEVDKKDCCIDEAILFGFPEEDRLIIEQDWNKIMAKIKAGKAHLITEGDTLYLAACTKGASSETMRQQPFSTIPAKQRAFSLKPSYVTRILERFIFGGYEDEHVIKSVEWMRGVTFEEAVIGMLQPYIGMSQEQLKKHFSIDPRSKNVNELLLARMLGMSGKVSHAYEFRNANIVPKTVRIQKNGHVRESMSFPAFHFTDIVDETWETSQLRNDLEPKKFLFVIFQEDERGGYVFAKARFWNIPSKDLEEVQRVWERTVQIIRRGVRLDYDGRVWRNDLPKKSESPVAHVRPHGRDAHDTLPLPDGRQMVRQCFWLNDRYIERIIKEEKET